MTYHETVTEIKADQWRFDRQMQVLSNFSAVIANPHYKKHIKGKDLYTPMGEKKVVSIEEHKRRFNKAVALMGADVIPVRKRAR